MEKKLSRAGRRRPPNLNIKAATLRAELVDTQSNRESADLTVIQPSMPVFASVHRPRHASISAIKRDSQASVQQHPGFPQNQHKNATFDVVYITGGRVDNGNVGCGGVVPTITKSKMPESTKHGMWQGIHHNYHHQHQHQNQQQHHHHHQQQQQQQQQQATIAVPLPQPFHQNQSQALGNGVRIQQGVVMATTSSGFGHQPLLHHLQQSNQQSAAMAHNRMSNFNQISKTATNILNDIYEKHLLNQTTFENITILNSRTAGIPLGMTAVANVGYGDVTTNTNGDNESFNVNNFHQKQQFVRTHQIHPQQQQQQQQQQQHQHQFHGPFPATVHIQQQQKAPPPPPMANGVIFQHHRQQQQHLHPHPHPHSHPHPQHQQHHQQQSKAVVEESPEHHLYETIDGPPYPPPPPISLTSRLLRKRLPGKFLKSSSGSKDTKQTSILKKSSVSVTSGVNDESHVAMNHLSHPPYTHHTRTRADGQSIVNDINPNNANRCKSNPIEIPPANIATSTTGPLLMTAHDITGLEKTKNPPLENVQNIREVPIGSLNQDGFNDAVTLPVHHRSTEPNEANFQNGHSTAKYPYRNGKIDLMLETAQTVAAAAYYAKAATKLAQNGGTSKTRSTEMSTMSARNGGYCGALQRAPPPLPANLARRLANKENYGIGRVKVMLRVSDNHEDDDTTHFMAVDKKKRQVTLTDPSTNTSMATTSQERGPMVSAPKMFAFDGLFTAEDPQNDVCASALSEVIPAVLEGSDGCLLSIGYPNSGQSKTMLGTLQAPHDLGAIPCAISWLYKGINERRQKSGARFSVRVSALGVSATKPESTSKDLLAAHATDSDESPGVYLRDDFLGGPTELRAPTAERAALFLDAALAGRPQSALEPAMIFTLHVYQYSLSGKGGVAGGRSRLHLIDLGGCANRNGGLPLSGIGNILLAILSGQRHPPNKDHPLTPLLKDCLAPLTCHVTIMAHVSHTQTHTDALTTIQLASRIHRMRRRKHRFQMAPDKTLGIANTGHQSGSSEGPDPSSSDLSADTVIYMGPCDDATDGEHPPVYLPSLSSGDNRCAMNKALKGSAAEKPTKLPTKRVQQKPQSPVVIQRTDSLKRTNIPSPTPTPSIEVQMQGFSPIHSIVKPTSTTTSPKIVAGALRHGNASKAPNATTPKGSPLRRPNATNPESPLRQISEEQWIDGPRVSRSKVAEARHLLREINHVKQCETWIDGPKSTNTKTLVAANLPGSNQAPGYGYMDSHKKTMIRQWVENQSSHVFQSPNLSPSHNHHQQQQQTGTHPLQTHQQQQTQPQSRTAATYHLTQFHKKSEDDQSTGFEQNPEMVNPIIEPTLSNLSSAITNLAETSNRSGLKPNRDETDVHSDKSIVSHCPDPQEEEDQDSGPSEVPPALPLIEPLSSREISHESLHRIISRHVSRESLSINQINNQTTIDCGLQVTEEEIARTMGGCEHPLAALSHGDMSIVSSFNIGDAFSDCAIGERTRNQFDQLARLREIFTSQLAMAEVTPAFRIGDSGSVYSEPAFRFNTGPGSVCSEPAYRPPSPRCRGCRQSLTISPAPSQTSLPSLNGIMTIAGMEQYASLRHPDGASDPNLPKVEKTQEEDEDDIMNEKTELLVKRPSLENDDKAILSEMPVMSQNQISQLPLLPLSTSEAYDSGHDSSTPRTSKHSGISRRAESGYHSVATARDSDESSFTSGVSKDHNRITMKKKRQDKSLCNWLRNPFTCTYPETEGEISDF